MMLTATDTDRCEICRKPLGTVEARATRESGAVDPETGTMGVLWEHVACRAESDRMREGQTGVGALRRHHDPIVADLIARVEALEAARKG